MNTKFLLIGIRAYLQYFQDRRKGPQMWPSKSFVTNPYDGWYGCRCPTYYRHLKPNLNDKTHRRITARDPGLAGSIVTRAPSIESKNKKESVMW